MHIVCAEPQSMNTKPTTPIPASPPLSSSDLFCDLTHRIKEEPRDTYAQRYPKAVAVWKNSSGRSRRLCANCGATHQRHGWTPQNQ
jgi:hypothetical protein